jgi:hypothetical protein
MINLHKVNFGAGVDWHTYELGVKNYPYSYDYDVYDVDYIKDQIFAYFMEWV